MSYVKNYFNKEQITDISLEDVTRFFSNEKEESDKIEYKSFVTKGTENIQEKTNAILRTICALLNSEGGLIIWGAPIGKKEEGKKEKIFIGELCPVEHLYEKDQFINKITDSISPTPKGILFHSIKKDNGYVYLFEIPKSEYSPHQFGDKFFMRVDGQTKPAPYHFIEALFKKIRYPNLQAYLKLDSFIFNSKICQLSITSYFFNLSKLQNDYNLSYRISCDIGKFHGHDLLNMNNNIRYLNGGHEILKLNVKDVLHYGEPIIENSILKFDPYKLQETNWEVTIIITFGAKNSPMKMCDYKLKLAPHIKTELINQCFTEIKENQFMFEVSEKTEEEKIESRIGRKISQI
ncbi:MAG: ATP-binding protein [Bacteroidetes bacterium]|nr:ATP-binding protein [Bacteroidota bacterium]